MRKCYLLVKCTLILLFPTLRRIIPWLSFNSVFQQFSILTSLPPSVSADTRREAACQLGSSYTVGLWSVFATLPGFRSVVGKGKAMQRLALTFSRGNLAFSPCQPTLQGSPVLLAVSARSRCCTCPGSLWEDGMRAAESWRRALLLLTIDSFSYLLKKWVLHADIPIYLLISVPLTLNCRAPSCQLQLVIS